jgi:DNA primase
MSSYHSAKEAIKAAVDIVELVGQYVKLKRAGQNHVGLCPFHSEKAPSFSVSAAKQMFHCFGCKKGGDIFAFWMEYHGATFPEAVKDLAERYQISLPERQMTPSRIKEKAAKESLIELNELATRFFHHILDKSADGKPGRAYLAQRALSQEVVSEFKLGYAPNEWDGLTTFLTRKGKDLRKAALAGLIIPKKNGGYYDRFRGRIIFPIFDLRKQIVGFGGRVLDDSLPKYLNTSETPVFQKGRLLYGLHTAHRFIRQSGRAVVVEGYTDTLALRRHGFQEAVATLGTALTRDHIRILKGYAREAVVVFDADASGKAAAMKSLPVFLNEGLSSRVLVLPENDDPDSFVNRHGLDSFMEKLERSEPMFEFYLDLVLSAAGEGIEGKINALRETLPLLAEVDSTAKRLLLVHRVSERMGISESAILAELQNWQVRPSRSGGRAVAETSLALAGKRGDDFPLLNLLIHAPRAIQSLVDHDCKILLSDPVVALIFDTMVRFYKSEGELRPTEVLEHLVDEGAKERFREAMLAPPIYPDEVVEQAVSEFKQNIQRRRISESINEARASGDIEKLNRLLKSIGPS